ncbi:MAG: hypothetical protein OEY29_13060 [Gammaproteobacteria bacterium]|nr:hypothetical protein [Gammaproteobacteria bacterium]
MRVVLLQSLTMLLLLVAHSAAAFELFGVVINTAQRQQIRDAIRNSGAEVIREAGEENLYDVYDMSAEFRQSKRLYVAYEKTAGGFAFAEYQLPYAYLNTMLKRLRLKYGQPKINYGTYESDTKYLWNVDGVDILLTQEWDKNISRLVYSQQQQLLQVQQLFRQTEEARQLKALELERSYF